MPIHPNQALSDMFAMGLTAENYRLLYRRSKQHFAPIWPSYDVLEKVKNELQPRDITVIPRPHLEVTASLQSVCQFQLEGIFLDPQVKARFLLFAQAGFQMRFVVKIGADGMGTLKVYFGADEEGSSLFASSFAPIALNASNGQDFARIYDNNRVNASSSHCYLRLKHEKEVKTISQKERDRLLGEVEDLVPIVIEGFSITVDVLCTCCDGKLKNHWCDVGMNSCYVCGAGPSELGLEWHEKFARNPLDRIRFGISLLHGFMRSFGWLLKGCVYRDFKKYEANEDERKMYVQPRNLEMEASLFEFSC